MNFELAEDQAMIAATIARFVEGQDVRARKRVRALPGGIDRDRWRELGEMGLIGLLTGSDHGGIGGSPVDGIVAAIALGAGCAVEPWLEAVTAARLIERAGGSHLLASILEGSVLPALACAERSGRYQLVPHEVEGRRVGDTYVIDGRKIHVLGAAADLFVVTADLDGEVALFTVPANEHGVDVRAYAIVDGSFAAEVVFRDVIATRLEGGLDALLDTVAEASLLAAAEMTGLADYLLAATIEHVRSRHQFGQPLGSFQAVQHRLADMVAHVEQLRSTTYRLALADRSNAAQWRREAAGGKAFAAEAALAVGHAAIQLHGGMGMTDELGIGHAHKRMLLLSRLFGDPAHGFATYSEAA